MKYLPLITITLLLSLCTTSALAQNKQTDQDKANYKAARAIAAESPPKFVAPEPIVSANLRLGVGMGVFNLTGDGAQDPKISGGGASLWVHAGDEFWDFIGYYLGARLNIFNPSTVEADGQTFDNYNEQNVFMVEGAAGLDLWLIPQWVGVSAEGVYNYGGVTLKPVDRSDYTLVNQFGGLGWRVRAMLRAGKVMLTGEYMKMLPVADQDNQTWNGWSALINIGYAPNMD